jgi:hypothetical protein
MWVNTAAFIDRGVVRWTMTGSLGVEGEPFDWRYGSIVRHTRAKTILETVQDDARDNISGEVPVKHSGFSWTHPDRTRQRRMFLPTET